MATIPTKKISELTTKTDTPTTETYVPVAEKSGETFTTKKYDLQKIYTAINSKLDATGKAVDSDKLDGKDSTEFAPAVHAHDDLYYTDFQQDSETTTGLTFGYKAGKFRNDNAIVSVSAGTVTLTDAATNYIEVDSAGMVSVNTTGFTSGQIPLFEVVTSGGVISSVTDKRSWLHLGGLRNIAEDTTPELGGELNAGLHSIGFTEKINTSSAGAVTIDWKTSNKQKITLTENTTFTFINPSNPCNLLLRIVQDATGGWTVTMPTLKTPGGTALTFSTAANAEDVLMLYFDGTNYIATILQDVR